MATQSSALQVTVSINSDGGAVLQSIGITADPQTGASPISTQFSSLTPTPATPLTSTYTTTLTLTGLTNGQTYAVSVTASNSVGTSAALQVSGLFTPVGAPSTPTSLSSTSGNRSVLVSWTASDWNGGEPTYTVQCALVTSPTQTVSTCITATLSCNVTDLQNSVPYVCNVTATNVFVFFFYISISQFLVDLCAHALTLFSQCWLLKCSASSSDAKHDPRHSSADQLTNR